MSVATDRQRVAKPRLDQGQAWAFAVIGLAVLIAYGAVWTRGIQGDDLCMCELASANGYWDAVLFWLQRWNGRLFLALTQIGTMHLPWFSSPLQAPWFILHAAVVLVHMAVCILLFCLMARAKIATGPALATVLVLAVHPVGFESVLWLAAAYGYVFGTLLVMLAIWAYLAYERTRRSIWLALTCVLALAAALGIEQYLVLLGALAVLQLFRSRRQEPGRSDWIPIYIVACCSAAFLVMHFGLFSSTGGRLNRAATATDQIVTSGSLWKLAWFMSVVPEASPYGGFLSFGIGILRQFGVLSALVVAAAVGAAWRIAARSAWMEGSGAISSRRYLSLIVAGLVIFMAAMLPFLVTGRYGFSMRNLYPALPGLLLASAAALHLISKSTLGRRWLRALAAPTVAAFVAISLVIDIGAQGIFARSWWFHRDLIYTIEADAAAIRAAGTLTVTGIPPVPYKSIAQIDSGWAFPCLVRWIVGDGDVKAWNNLMSAEPSPDVFQRSHHILWTGY